MGIVTAFSKKELIDDLVSDIKEQLRGTDARMVMYFASSALNPAEIGEKMQAAFAGITVFGCTTAGEIISGQMLTDSVVAMAFGPDVVEDVRVEVLENLKEGVDVKPMLAALENYYKTPLDELDLTRYVGIVLIDGLSGAEEKIMDKLGYRTNLTIIGGSAGDNLSFKETFIYANGRPYTNSALLALVKLKKGFDVIKTESFDIMGPKFTVTKANEAEREVIEFDGKPAAVAYSDAVFCKPIEAINFFMHHPVGVIIDGKPYVRSPQKLKGNSLVFYCTIPEGMEVALLESTDIIKDTEQAIKEKLQELGSISGMINFHCILRTLELDTNGTAEAYGEVFSEIPTIGFSTYGEEYLAHINQTSTILIFK
ncbi:MAG TPA: FIST N-terminal domain-containing protein [Methanocella sp.]|nr:FIST N-terminal domain-containing protein [Methanocella sp.]